MVEFQITKYGYPTLVASPWYLNYVSYGLDWEKYYLAEPLDFNGSDAEKALVSIIYLVNMLLV